MNRTGDGIADTAEATPADTTAADRPGLLRNDPLEREVGATMGRYQITGVLGAGGMGKVYRARDPDLNRELAIKVLRRAPGSGSGGLAHRLLREAQAMAKLNHPNLATVYDVGSVDGEVFIAFELVDGGTLGAWARGDTTFDQRLAALLAAGRGLEAAHSAGVIHRDFKPDNVLVGRDGAVKVVDFGLARGIDGAEAPDRAARGDALASDLTLTGSILGTPAYMAPEQHRGAVADARADQFGFAVAAWEILYGERPFRGHTLEELAAAIDGGEINPRPAGGGGGPALEAALRRALAVEPADRFSDLGALLAALTPIAPAAVPVVSAPSHRRWPLVLAAAAVAAGVLGLVLSGSSNTPVQPPAPPPPFTPPPFAPPALPAAPAVPDLPRPAPADSDQAAIRASIRQNIAGVHACYETAVAKQPELGAGRITIEFEIGAAGRVVGTRIVDDPFVGHADIATCVAALSLAWQFAPPAGGGAVKVTYPFDFHPFPVDITHDKHRYKISRATWDGWLKDHQRLSRGVKAVPSMVDGRQVGWKIFGIGPNSVQALLGFESGDTLTHIDDQALTDIEGTAAVMDRIDGTRPVTITFRRRNQTLEHTYELTD